LAESRRTYAESTLSLPPETDQEVREWLTTVLSAEELRSWKTTATGKLCVGADHLKTLGHVPAARPLLDIRGKDRLLQNFGHAFAERISPATGRIHCDFRIAAAKTGRFSSSKPNLQNLPARKAPKFRECIIADNDHVIAVADYGQIEVRVAAHNAQECRMTDILAAGGDFHTKNAAMILAVPESEITKEQRQMAKAVTFGVLYGMGPEGLAAYAYVVFRVKLTVDEAQRLLDSFFAAYPDLLPHLMRVWGQCKRDGYIRIMPSGRLIRREWEGWISKQDAFNWPIQGGAADCMLQAIPLVYRAFRMANIRGGLIATVHDELLAEVHCDDAAVAAEIMQREMTRAFEISFPGAPTTGLLEVGIGSNWRAAKEATKETS